MRTLLIVALAAAVLAPAAGATYPGKDGRLVYSGADDHLHSILPSGAGQRTISTGIDGKPVFSADGRSIAFSRQENGPAGSPRNRIWVASADGAGAHPVTSFDSADSTWMADGQPAWTPDGQLLYIHFVSRYADASCILSQPAVISAPATTVLCGGTDIVQSPLPSPVGKRLAFFRSRPRDGRPGMIFADQLWLDGAPTSVLATQGDWSPDGARLLLRQLDGSLGVLDVGTNTLTQLGVKAINFTWSPDGSSIAYIAAGKLSIAAANGSRPRLVAARVSSGGLAWQPLPR